MEREGTGVVQREWVRAQRKNWKKGQRWYSRSKVRGTVEGADTHEEGRSREENWDGEDGMRRWEVHGRGHTVGCTADSRSLGAKQLLCYFMVV